MFSFSFDAATGVLAISVSSGTWTLAEIDRYAGEAAMQFASARRLAGSLRLLVDLSSASILSQALMEPLAKAGMQYARSDDKVAMVVGSTLLKLQMKRMIGNAPTPIFLTRQEAESWLVAPGLARVSAG